MPENVEVATARLLSLVSWIGEHPGVSVEELGRHFSRSPRQVERDVELLGAQGDSLPGSSFEFDWDLYERERCLRIRTTMGVDLPPRLTRTEATAVLVGLRAIAPALDDDLRARLTHTALAVGRMAPGSAPLEALAVSGESAHDPRLDVVRRAIQARTHLRFTYTRPDGAVSERLVDPWSLRLGREGWVLSGWCHRSEDRRAFRLDRMSALVGDDTPADRADPGEAPAGGHVTVRVGRQAHWVVDDLGAELVAEDEDTLTASVPVWDHRWLESLLVDLAPHLRGCSDVGALEGMRGRARAALATWGVAP